VSKVEMMAVVVEVKSRACSIDVSIYTRSIYHKYGIAQSTDVAQAQSLSQLGPTAQWTVEKRGDDGLIPYMAIWVI